MRSSLYLGIMLNIDRVPQVGDTVLYVLDTAEAHKGSEVMQGHTFADSLEHSNQARLLPAVVVRTWGSTKHGAINLKVINDGQGTMWRTSVCHWFSGIEPPMNTLGADHGVKSRVWIWPEEMEYGDYALMDMYAPAWMTPPPTVEITGDMEIKGTGDISVQKTATGNLGNSDIITDFPRRGIQEKLWPAEIMIDECIDQVETMGADVNLTDAVVLLGQARDKVSDYIDGRRTEREEVSDDGE